VSGNVRLRTPSNASCTGRSRLSACCCSSQHCSRLLAPCSCFLHRRSWKVTPYFLTAAPGAHELALLAQHCGVFAGTFHAMGSTEGAADCCFLLPASCSAVPGAHERGVFGAAMRCRRGRLRPRRRPLRLPAAGAPAIHVLLPFCCSAAASVGEAGMRSRCIPAS